jgi:hypothetical protein
MDNTVITCQTINNGYLEGHRPMGYDRAREKMRKKPLETMRRTFVGMPYSLMVAHQIESCGYGFVVSCETGNISNVFDPSSQE